MTWPTVIFVASIPEYQTAMANIRTEKVDRGYVTLILELIWSPVPASEQMHSDRSEMTIRLRYNKSISQAEYRLWKQNRLL